MAGENTKRKAVTPFQNRRTETGKCPGEFCQFTVYGDTVGMPLEGDPRVGN